MTNECFVALSKCVSKFVEAFERQEDARLIVAVGIRPAVAAGGILPVLRIGIKICTDSYIQC